MRNFTSPLVRKNHLSEIAGRQYSYFSANQAKQTGYADSNHQYHFVKGNWIKISAGLFRLPGYPDSTDAEFTKWSLWSRFYSLDLS